MQTFQRIRTNRQGRLRAKTRKRKGDSESEFTEHIRNSQCQSCPVCHGRLQRTPEEIAQHVEDCLRKVSQSIAMTNKCNEQMLNGYFSPFKWKKQSGQSRSEEEDETVDVESYGDETSSSAMNLAAAQNNNNVVKHDSIRPTIRPMPFTSVANSSSNCMSNEEHMITSRSGIWQQHTKHLHRLGPSPPNMNAVNVSMANSIPISCAPPNLFPNESSGATPTSSDQINEYDRTNTESPNTRISQDRHNNRINNDLQKSNNREMKNGIETTHNNCDNDNDEEVIVTNDEDDCPKKMPSKDLKRCDKNRYESNQLKLRTLKQILKKKKK